MSDKHEDRFDRLFEKLGEISGKQDAMLQRDKAHEKRLDELDSRVSKLESWKAWLVGIGITIGTLATFLTSEIKAFFGGR